MKYLMIVVLVTLSASMASADTFTAKTGLLSNVAIDGSVFITAVLDGGELVELNNRPAAKDPILGSVRIGGREYLVYGLAGRPGAGPIYISEMRG